nr:decaprenyl-phosphate phosphoribosyltransferase [uncultured Desulfuromonas sp.]
MLFFPPFLAGKFFEIDSVASLVVPFFCFSLFASSCYILNDVADVHADRDHPKKCHRPVASGVVSIRRALVLAFLMATAALLLSLVFVPLLWPWLFGYFILSSFYTFFLKHVAWLDLLAIASFFLLRLQAGGAVYHVQITLWLYLSVFLLAIFLSVGKRLSEVLQLGRSAASHRRVLSQYTVDQLNLMLKWSGGTVLLTYAMYCVTHHALLYSIPLCAYGLYRYSRRVQMGNDGDPTTSLLKDWQLFLVGSAWGVMVTFALYG